MKTKMTIISRSGTINNQICPLFTNEDYEYSFIKIDALTIETFSEIETTLLIIDITNNSLNKIKLLFTKLDLKTISYGIVFIIANKLIPAFNFLDESLIVHFVGKPIRVEEFRIRIKKMLFISKTNLQIAAKQQQLQWEIKKQTSDLAATFQIAEYQSHLLDLVLNSVPAGFLAIDISQDVALMNKKAEEILKIPFSKAAGKSIWRIVESNTRKHLQEQLINNVASNFENPCIIKSPDGIENYYEIMIRDFNDNDGKVIGKLLIFVNVTSRMEASRIKNSLFTIVSHELRTPLTIINNGVTLLRMEKDGAEQDQIISDITEATERSSELVTNILHITHLNEVNVRPLYREINKSDLLKKLLIQFQSKFTKKKIELIQTDTTDIAKIVTDPGLINMALSSILDNAIKYNKYSGRIFITIYRENDLICFEIKDEGKGFKGETSKMFFHGFTQGENNLTRTHNGIGVGLYIAKRATDLLKGDISFTSENEIGSTFILKIPVVPNH
jgi:signal transduction histidine kinase